MTKGEEKENLSRLQEQYLLDLAHALTIYKLKTLAELIGISPQNLSRSQKKPPGIRGLEKFYRALPPGIAKNPFEKTNLNNMENKQEKKDQQHGAQQGSSNEKKNAAYDHSDTQNQAEEPDPLALYDDSKDGRTNELIATLRTENAHHRKVESKMLESSDKLFSLPHKWLHSLDKMVETQSLSNQKDLINAETHKMMMEAWVKKYGEKQ